MAVHRTSGSSARLRHVGPAPAPGSRRRQKGRLVGAAAAAALVAVACSSTKSASSSTTAAPAASAAPGSTAAAGPSNTVGVTDTTVTIGGIYAAAAYPGAPLGVQAAINDVNTSGGINGRKVVLSEMIDDGLDPNKDLAAAKRLVEVDHVFAVVPSETFVFTGSAKYLASVQTPAFGRGDDLGFCDNDYTFAYIGCSFPVSKNINNYGPSFDKAVPGGIKGKAIAFIGIDNDSAKVGQAGFASVLKNDGMNVVASISTIPTPPAVVGDYSPYVSQLLSSNGGKQPDVIMGSLPSTNEAPLVAALNNAGYKGVYIGFSSYNSKVAAAVKGAYMIYQLAPIEQNTSAVQQMLASIKAVNTNNETVDDSVVQAYWDAKIFIEGLRKTGKNLTKQAFMNTMNTSFDYNVPGGLGEVKWPEFHTGGRTCNAILQSTGTAFRVAVPFMCVPNVPNPNPQPLPSQ